MPEHAKPEDVEDACLYKEGEVRLRDAFSREHVVVTLQTLFVFASLGISLGVTVDNYATWSIPESVFVTGAVITIGFCAFWMLKHLDCRLRDNHVCWNCRGDTERSEADS